jgi:amidohydrolase
MDLEQVLVGQNLYEEIYELAGRLEPEVTQWRHWLHRHPELPNREQNTARYILDHLRTLNLDEVRSGIAGHGIVGVLRGGRPGDRVMALRADFDALAVTENSGVSFASTTIDENYPGGPFPVSHACGHDCHTAMLMGAASVLSRVRDNLPGTVLFVFQPAQEGPPAGENGGAAQMLAEGALDDPVPTMVYGHHVAPLPTGYVGYRTGNQFGASCMMKVVITGQWVEGSTPAEGEDPLPAAAAIISAIGQMYRQVDGFNPVTITIGHLEDVGRFNIVGRQVTLWGTIRCAIESDMAKVQQIVTRTATGSAHAFDCTAAATYLQAVPAVHNLQRWVDASLPTLERIVGRDKVVQIPATPGHDDVSEFVNKYGGLYVLLGCQDLQFKAGELVPLPGGKGAVVNHNPAFYANDAVLATGTRIHATMAVDHLTSLITPHEG